jgi:hypothetical protein
MPTEIPLKEGLIKTEYPLIKIPIGEKNDTQILNLLITTNLRVTLN